MINRLTKPLACTLITISCLALVTPTTAQQQVTVLNGARILPVTGKPIENGIVVMFGGKIQLVGNAETTIPDGALVIDCKGKIITPGLIDAGTQLSVSSKNSNEQFEEPIAGYDRGDYVATCACKPE